MNYSDIFNLILSTDYNHSKYDGDWQVVVNQEEKTIFVLFEKSNGKKDWFHNFLFFPIPVKPFKRMENPWFIHWGFKRVYHYFRDDMLKKVDEKTKEFPNFKIIVAGYSHGGALAQIAIEDIKFNLGKPSKLITFGSPKPFFGKSTLEKVKKIVGSNLKIFENGSDIVPCLPPLFYYSLGKNHIGEKFSIWNIFKTGKYHTGYGNKNLY